MSRGRDQAGQASAELVAVVPLVVVLALVLAQLAVAGYGLWSAAAAARAGARAAHVGADPVRVAQRALPAALRPGDVRAEQGKVDVEVEAPALLPGLQGVAVRASAALDPSAGAR